MMTMKQTIAKKLARKLMDEHSLKNWKFEFDTSVKRFGCCDYKQRTIRLSKKLVELNSEERVTNTILHEIAHALIEPFHGHDKFWKMTAKKIGCDGMRLYNSDIVIQPRAKYQAICKNCGKVSLRHKRVRRHTSIACGRCCRLHNHNRYAKKYKLIFRKIEEGGEYNG